MPSLCVLALVSSCIVVLTTEAVAFEGVFDSSTFSASSTSEAQLGSALQSYFSWGDAPIFSQFEGGPGSSDPNTIIVFFAFGSSDPTANQLQIKYATDLSSYIDEHPNATLLRGSLNNNGIILISIVVFSPTVAPPPSSPNDDADFGPYLPAVIVGGVVAVVIVVGAAVFIVMKRRAAFDDRIFDAMEAMMDEEGERATRGVEGIHSPTASGATSGGSTLPAPLAPAPPPRQVV